MSKSNQELIEYFEKKYGKEITGFYLVEWSEISQSKDPYLTENFIREFKNKVNWYEISCNQKLSEEFIREFKNKVEWTWISYYQLLSGEFIGEFIDKNILFHFSKHNKINYLKYKLKSGKISNEEYLKELICQSKN